MSELKKEVRALREALDAFETGIGDGPVSDAALEDFKMTVDTVRTTVLAMMTADDPDDYENFVHNYRLRRGAQVCQSVFSGLVDGTIYPETPGYDQLRSTVQETLARLDRLLVRA